MKATYAAIEKGMAKGMMRPLPIICMLLPRSGLADADAGAEHPDPDGRHLEMIVNALDQRWGEFTRRRGGTQSTGVTDIGVFIEWSSVNVARPEKSRRPEHELAVLEEARR